MWLSSAQGFKEKAAEKYQMALNAPLPTGWSSARRVCVTTRGQLVFSPLFPQVKTASSPSKRLPPSSRALDCTTRLPL
jgi:hypothetical protein